MQIRCQNPTCRKYFELGDPPAEACPHCTRRYWSNLGPDLPDPHGPFKLTRDDRLFLKVNRIKVDDGA